jgi:tetratricopeptide (TPR) repeat protein
MKHRVIQSTVACLFCLILSQAALGQEIDPRLRTADTNNAVIKGRVTLPSGFTIEGYARITLRTDQSILSTLYTNNTGEFQVRNLSQGIYFVEAEIPKSNFETTVRRVELGRGLMVDLTLELREKKDLSITANSAKVVSASELRQAVPAAAKRQYELGLKSVNKGDFQQAATHFQEAVSIYPEYLAARNDLGAQYLKLKRIDEAEAHFQIVLTNDPKNFNAKFNMGLVQIERHNYLGALTLLNQAVSIDSSRAVAHLWIGIAKLEMGSLQEAEASLVRSLLMGGDECVAAHYHLARIFMSRGEVSDASRSVNAYLHEAPKGEFATEAKELARRIKNQKSN